MDSDAEQHAPIVGERLVFQRERALDLEGAADRANGAGELGEQIVARGVDHPSAKRVDQALDFAAMGPKREDRGLVVVVHQPAVADPIGAQNGRQPAIQGLRGHLQLPRELPSA